MNTIAQVANQSTGLFIGITEDDSTYTVRAHGDGHLVTDSLTKAIAYATEIAVDAKDDSPAEDTEALTEFIVELSVIEALDKGEAWSTADVEDAILEALDTEEATDETFTAAREIVEHLMATGLYFRTGPDQRIMVK